MAFKNFEKKIFFPSKMIKRTFFLWRHAIWPFGDILSFIHCYKRVPIIEYAYFLSMSYTFGKTASRFLISGCPEHQLKLEIFLVSKSTQDLPFHWMPITICRVSDNHIEKVFFELLPNFPIKIHWTWLYLMD